MENLQNGFTLDCGIRSFPLSTDSMVLAHFARLPRHARILDLGSGCGTLGVLLCARDSGCRVVGVELDVGAHEDALENIRRNGLQDRMESICADLRSVSALFTGGSFSCIISNPPYFSGGLPSRSHPMARGEATCTPAQLMEAAAWALKYGGDFYLVHKPERLSELLVCASRFSLEAKRLCLVRHQAGAPVNLILLQLRKGAKPGLCWEEMTLHHADGTPTRQYYDIYHTKEA